MLVAIATAAELHGSVAIALAVAIAVVVAVSVAVAVAVAVEYNSCISIEKNHTTGSYYFNKILKVLFIIQTSST